MKKWFAISMFLAAAGILSTLHAPAAFAANGQCKWEGGPGKATYPACEAEDCAGNGGTAQCTRGVGAPKTPYTDAIVGPDGWAYGACDEGPPQIPKDARWCTSAGGTWVGNGAKCNNLPGGVIGGGGTVTNNEAQIIATADAFAQSYGYSLSSDTGWHTTFTSNFCFAGADTSALGVPTFTARRRVYRASASSITISFSKGRQAKCPPGYKSRTAVGVGAECFLPGECCDSKVANPVSAISGTKFASELDYAGIAGGELALQRFYKSTGYFRPRNLTTAAPNPDEIHVSEFWRNSFQQQLFIVTGNAEVSAIQQSADGSTRSFDSAGKEVGNIEGGAATLAAISGIGWDLTLDNHDVERYDNSGKLIKITTRAGIVTTVGYDACGMVSTATGAFGHVLAFTNDCTKRRPVMVTLPDSSTIAYAYDQWDRLSSVTYPDSTTRVYSYGDVRNKWLLTAIQDESGQVFASYSYDASGRAITSEHANGAERYVFTYGTNNSTTVVDPQGATTQYAFSSSAGALRRASHSMACMDCGNVASRTYDAKGNPATATDFAGVQTQFTFDPVRNLELSRTEAFGTPRARTIATQWHPTFRQPAQIEGAGRRINFTHDANGNVLTSTVTDLVTSATRTWTYTYDAYGRVLTENGPRTDVVDTTTYTYYSCSTGNECGQLHTAQNALGQVTTFNTYNADGQPLTITDANGVVNTLVYDSRQRLTSRSAGGETTSYEYWPTGLLKKTTLPDMAVIRYTYDAAHRLVRVEDAAGNYVRYVLDSAGNRTEENTYDLAGVLASKRKQVFNGLNLLWKQVAAAGTSAVTTSFAYDAAGNLTNTNAPLSRNSVSQYDELNRLKQITDAGSGATQFAYDALDNLTSVADPRSVVTGYQYNRFGDLTQLSSPDTGVTANTYDSAGNLLTTTDARGKTGTYTYDSANRPTSLSYPDQATNYTYDAGAFGKGHLTGASDSNHSLAWTLDALGRVTGKTQIVTGMSKAISYGYSSGQRTSMTLPSGRVVTYGYANGRVDRISVDGIEVLADVRYKPFGSVAGWTWGNGTTTSRTYNLDGKITGVNSAGSTTYGYDNAFRITDINDLDSAARSWAYGYDALDRLTSASRTDLSQTWTYDANGNRLSEGGSTSSTHNVSSTSNRVASVSGSLSRTYAYADSGQVTGYGGLNFAYNDAGRLTGVSGSASANYTINALGQRVKKVVGGATTYFLYDEEGRLAGEYDGGGALIEEIVWLGDIPVATLRDCSCGDAIFYIHTDHLNTPRRITKRSSNTVVWRWDSDPFGAAPPNEDPDGDSTAFVFNLRFPGQYFDAETGLHYNYFRDYDPAVGRYAQSDPIGMEGGLNTYGYVGSNPVGAVDMLGLDSLTIACMERPDVCAEIFGDMVTSHADLATGGCATREFNPSTGLRVVSGAITVIGVVRLGQGLVQIANSIRAMGAAARGGSELTRVGRWMSKKEFDQMSATGRVVEGAGGRTSVIRPPNPASFNPPPTSPIYAEFNVPSGVLRQGGKVDWAWIPGPSLQSRAFGPVPATPAPATCIVCVIGGN